MSERPATETTDARRVSRYEPGLPEVRSDPYPLYHALREEAPIGWSPILDAWVLTRYADVVSVLRDSRFSSDFGNRDGYDAETDPLGEVLRRLILFMDAPDHTRLRSLVHRAFTPRVVESLRPRVEAVVSDLLDGMAERDESDLIADLAYPLPVVVICELLGVPPTDRELFKRLTPPITRMLDPLAETADDEVLQQAGESVTGFMTYFLDLMAERRRRPGSDLISRMLAVKEHDDVLTEEEILAMCGLLIIAGHETTMNLIGNGTLALLRNPDELALLRADPSLDRPAVEELLRFDSPVQLTVRTALQDVELDGANVGAHTQVVALLGAANRDPGRFADPDRLSVARPDVQHVAFGAGAHFCLGAPLARLEGLLAIPALLRRFPALELAEEPVWRDTVTLHGLRSLRLTLR